MTDVKTNESGQATDVASASENATPNKFRDLLLPAWAALGKTKKGLSCQIEVDTDAAIRHWLELLDAPAVDQYWVECAYQCVKMDIQGSLQGTEFDPQFPEQLKSAQIHMTRAPDFELATLPKGEGGRGVKEATQGLDARKHFKRVRGYIPFSG